MSTTLLELPATQGTKPAKDATVDERAVAALLACIARTGWAKTTFDDVAREAGCARATLYRYFAGKPALLAATVDAERDRLAAALSAATEHATTLEDALVAVVTTGARAVRDHRALQFLFAFEPEAVLPYLTFSGGDVTLAAAGSVVGPALGRFLPDGVDAEQAGEWVARATLVYVSSPTAPFDLASEADARTLVREFLAPALARSSVTARG